MRIGAAQGAERIVTRGGGEVRTGSLSTPRIVKRRGWNKRGEAPRQTGEDAERTGGTGLGSKRHGRGLTQEVSKRRGNLAGQGTHAQTKKTLQRVENKKHEVAGTAQTHSIK